MELLGDALISALETTGDPLIEVRDQKRLLGRVSRPIALGLARSGNYTGVGSTKRVRHLRQKVLDVRPFTVDSTFWDGRSVLRFWPYQTSDGMVTHNRLHLFREADKPAGNKSKTADKPTSRELRTPGGFLPVPK
jgi:hypothetical protein